MLMEAKNKKSAAAIAVVLLVIAAEHSFIPFRPDGPAVG